MVTLRTRPPKPPRRLPGYYSGRFANPFTYVLGLARRRARPKALPGRGGAPVTLARPQPKIGRDV